MAAKAVFTFSILGLLAGTFGDAVIAERIGADMPWFAQFGLCGLFGAMLWWSMAKTIPKITSDAKEAVIEGAKINAEAMSEMKTEFHGFRADVKEGHDATLNLLREVIFQNRGPK